jgi:hypothetical protein
MFTVILLILPYLCAFFLLMCHKFKHTYLIWLILALFSACTFKNHEEAFTHIKKGEPDPFSIGFFDDSDTLYIGHSQSLNFYPPVEEKNIIGYALYLDDEQISKSTDGVIRDYQMIPENHAAGYRKLRLEYYQKTNSGSLADKFDLEVFPFVFEKVLLIDNAPVNPMKITKTEIVDSTLVIHWNKFTGYEFEYYRIRGSGLDTTIYDKNVDRLAIPAYGGGKIAFYFEIKAKKLFQYSSTDSYHYDLEFTAEQQSEDSVRVTWGSSPFRYMQGMKVQFLYFNEKAVEIRTGAQATDTLLYFPTPIPYNYSIEAHPLGTTHRVTFNYLQMRTSSAGKISGTVMRQIDQNNFLITRYNAYSGQEDEAYTYDLSTATETSYRRGKLATSFNGKNFFQVDIQSNQIGLVRYNGSNLSRATGSASINLQETKNQWIWSAHVSDDLYVLIFYGESANAPRSYVCYHWPSRSVAYAGVLGTNLSTKPSKSGWLAPGGRYFMHDNLYYDLSVTPLAITKTLSYHSDLTNLPHRNQYLFKQSSSQFILRTLQDNTLTPIRTFNIEGTSIKVTYNEFHHFAVLVKKSDNTYWFEVYDFDTGEQLGRIQLSPAYSEFQIEGFKLFGNYLWLSLDAPYNTSGLNYLHQFRFEP